MTALVDAPTRVSLRCLCLGRRATEQYRYRRRLLSPPARVLVRDLGRRQNLDHAFCSIRCLYPDERRVEGVSLSPVLSASEIAGPLSRRRLKHLSRRSLGEGGSRTTFHAPRITHHAARPVTTRPPFCNGRLFVLRPTVSVCGQTRMCNAWERPPRL